MNQVGSVIQSVVDRMKDAQHRLKIEINSEKLVPANPQHLEQLIQNLLVNSLIHTNSAIVSVIVDSEGFSVSDSGPGIPSEILSRLGEPFNKGKSTAQLRSGHGLGLAWIYSICRLYGWDLKILNLNPGTQVRVRFNSDDLGQS